MNLAEDFLQRISSRCFPWKKQEEKITPKPTARFKSEFRSFAAKIRSPEGSPAKKIYVYVPFSFLTNSEPQRILWESRPRTKKVPLPPTDTLPAPVPPPLPRLLSSERPLSISKCSQLRTTKLIIFRPKSVNNYLNNSRNHFRSVNWMSVILHSQMLQTLCKPEITKNTFREGQRRQLIT